MTAQTCGLSICFALGLSLSPAATGNGDLLTVHKSAWGGHYETPDRNAVARSENLFVRLLGATSDLDEQKRDWAQLGFDCFIITHDQQPILVLKESEGQRLGRGVYLVRLESTQDILWQAPHSAHDQHTGQLAFEFFAKSGSRAAAWNTVHRREVDLAREPVSFYQAFTRAFAHCHPGGMVAQIHGFSREKRDTSRARNSDVILSSGQRVPSDSTRHLATCLGQESVLEIAVYGKDAFELGGTRNAQSRLLSSMAFANFQHIELNLATRRRLLKSVSLRETFIRCLARIE